MNRFPEGTFRHLLLIERLLLLSFSISIMINYSYLGVVLLLLYAVQASPVLESSIQTGEQPTAKHNEQLYELYKMMRTDPRLASIPNNELVLYIHRNFALGQHDHVMNLIKAKYQQEP
jgi:hypothetical protein